MALITKSINGTQDILPVEIGKWRHIEKTCFDTAKLYGFSEIRTPVFEHTELFQRGVGDTTDVVQKEMYTFLDKGGRSLTLRPELTASSVRASVERGLIFDALPAKLCYCGGCYRSERPQAGRLREFHQFGIELYGASSPAADAEVIRLGAHIIDALGLSNVELEINSIGCPECRKVYAQALKDYFAPHIDDMCNTCHERIERNPMRLLDCKADCCKEIAKDAPSILDSLCDECAEHFEKVKRYLTSMGVKYSVNPRIVRGLDYYTRTVFEFTSTDIGAQCALGGGGRYDGLFAELGGPDTPAVGFAMGLERLKLAMEAQNVEFPADESPLIYLAPMGDAAIEQCLALCERLRGEGFAAETDLSGRSVKAQMKYANKRGFRFTCVIGDNELETGVAKLKNMESGEEQEVNIKYELVNALYDVCIAETLKGLDDLDNGPIADFFSNKEEGESADMSELFAMLGAMGVSDEEPAQVPCEECCECEHEMAQEPVDQPTEAVDLGSAAYDLDLGFGGEVKAPTDDLPAYDLDLSCFDFEAAVEAADNKEE